MRKTLYLLFLLGTVLCHCCPADDRAQDRSTLVGLKAVRVLIAMRPADATQLGLDRMQTDVELRLRRSGIKVDRSAEACLKVSVSAARVADLAPRVADPRLYVIHILVELVQPVALPRDPGKLNRGTTWYVSTLGFFSLDRLDDVRQGIAEDVDEFINAYLSVNQQ